MLCSWGFRLHPLDSPRPQICTSAQCPLGPHICGIQTLGSVPQAPPSFLGPHICVSKHCSLMLPTVSLGPQALLPAPPAPRASYLCPWELSFSPSVAQLPQPPIIVSKLCHLALVTLCPPTQP